MILAEGKDNDKFYVISKGMVEVVLPATQSIRCDRPGTRSRQIFWRNGIFPRTQEQGIDPRAVGGPVEVLSINYDQLNELLNQSEATREALHQAAERHVQENVERRTKA